MSRDRAKELAKKKDIKLPRIPKNLDILVFGEKSGSKLKAKDLKINILNEKDFLNLIN